MPLRSPICGCGTPIGTQQRISLLHQGWQRLVGFCLAVQVLRHLGLAVDVIQLGAQGLCIRQGIVAHHHAGCFHQTRLNGVIQAKVRDHPGKQPRFRVVAPRRSKRCG